MKRIISSRLDELKQERDEWDAKYNEYEQIHDKQRAEYNKAEAYLEALVMDSIYLDLKKFDLLKFDIGVDIHGYRGTSIRIRCNEGRNFDKTSALSWDFEAVLNKDGEVEKETGSWSGLEATTPESIQSLEQTLEALKYLNVVDWESILDVEDVKWEDYFTEPTISRSNRPDFENQIKEEELKEFIGKPICLKGKGIDSLGYNRRTTVWDQIDRETPNKFIVRTLGDWYVSQYGFEKIMDYEPVQVKKQYLIDSLEYPYVTQEI